MCLDVAFVECSTGNCPLNAALYLETGDLAELPLLCDYPVKVTAHSGRPTTGQFVGI